MARFPRLKKRSVLAVLGIAILILIAAGIFFHILPGPGALARFFEPKASPAVLNPLAGAVNSVTAPMNRPLIADFLHASASEYTPLSIRFIDLSRGSPATWDWDFGDGTTGSLQDQVHEYQKSGLYNVTMRITRPDGSVRSVAVNDVLGIANPEPRQVLVDTLRQGTLEKGSFLTFVSTNSDSYCSINGNRIALPNGSVVKLRTNTDGDGMVSIRQGNLLKFSVPDATLYVNGSQLAQGSSGDCSLPDFRYFSTNFTYTVVPTKGDVRQVAINGQKILAGVENSRIMIVHESDDHNADLTLVTNPAFFEGSAAQLEITPAVIADFSTVSPRAGDAPLNITFGDQSAGDPTAWAWDFGDGSRSTEENPAHRYITPGAYTVTLTASRGALSDTIAEKSFIVATPPRLVANFSAFPIKGVIPLVVRFTDNSTGSPWMWNWNFWEVGNATPSSSSQQNPEITFTEPGTYNVWLSVNNIYGSSDLMRPQYIIVTDPYRFPDTMLQVQTGKQGYIEKDSCIQFIVGNSPATISINGGYRDLPKGALVRIEALSNQKGDIYIDNGQLLKFTLPDAAIYIDGDLVAAGKIDSIYVPYMTDFRTALSYYLEPASSWTTVTENGYRVLGDWDNAWIRFSNIGMNTGGSLRLTVSDNATLIDGADNQTVHDWVVQ
ncbi:PKD domain-containing protein [Methanoregula sp.]|uniref:PKD domain-containing protein n=1 Tax=Methanoregula sp. TaxID=2052170 RepID=UPI003C2AACC2